MSRVCGHTLMSLSGSLLLGPPIHSFLRQLSSSVVLPPLSHSSSTSRGLAPSSSTSRGLAPPLLLSSSFLYFTDCVLLLCFFALLEKRTLLAHCTRPVRDGWRDTRREKVEEEPEEEEEGEEEEEEEEEEDV